MDMRTTSIPLPSIEYCVLSGKRQGLLSKAVQCSQILQGPVAITVTSSSWNFVRRVWTAFSSFLLLASISCRLCIGRTMLTTNALRYFRMRALHSLRFPSAEGRYGSFRTFRRCFVRTVLPHQEKRRFDPLWIFYIPRIRFRWMR